MTTRWNAWRPIDDDDGSSWANERIWVFSWKKQIFTYRVTLNKYQWSCFIRCADVSSFIRVSSSLTAHTVRVVPVRPRGGRGIVWLQRQQLQKKDVSAGNLFYFSLWSRSSIFCCSTADCEWSVQWFCIAMANFQMVAQQIMHVHSLNWNAA